MLRSKYDAHVEGGVILVEDTCEPGARSVTNDAEQVVAEVVERFGDLPIKYKDTNTNGRWDWLVHYKGEFTGFLSGNQPYPGDPGRRRT